MRYEENIIVITVEKVQIMSWPVDVVDTWLCGGCTADCNLFLSPCLRHGCELVADYVVQLYVLQGVH